jgi:hypothetical protein
MNKITFDKNSHDLKLLAIYVAELTRQGVTFEIRECGNDGIGHWVEVILTGGF